MALSYDFPYRLIVTIANFLFSWLFCDKEKILSYLILILTESNTIHNVWTTMSKTRYNFVCLFYFCGSYRPNLRYTKCWYYDIHALNFSYLGGMKRCSWRNERSRNWKKNYGDEKHQQCQRGNLYPVFYFHMELFSAPRRTTLQGKVPISKKSENQGLWWKTAWK